MKAAWYEKQGAARDVLVVGEMEDPQLSLPKTAFVLRQLNFHGRNDSLQTWQFCHDCVRTLPLS